MLDYYIYDVFTDTPLRGNPLAVVIGGEHLDDRSMQKIAGEFNLSETVFVLPPSDPAHSAKLKIFTPTREVPFAGHPTIGATIALSDLGYGKDLVLELGIGPLPAEVREERASFVTRTPLEILYPEVDADLVARCLGIEAEHLRSVNGPIIAGVGLEFLFAPLKERDDLMRIEISIEAFREGARRYPTPLDFAIMAYVPVGDTCFARMFAPLDNIFEDPATGSACAALGALLCQRRGKPQKLVIHQGIEMGRSSRIEVEAAPDRVKVSGKAVRVMEGRLML